MVLGAQQIPTISLRANTCPASYWIPCCLCVQPLPIHWMGDGAPCLPAQVNQESSIVNSGIDHLAVVKKDGSVWLHDQRQAGAAWAGKLILPKGTMV